MYNKKGRPNREHRCGAGQILSECQVRTSHNSRVLEMDKLCVLQFVRVFGLLQQQRIDIPSLIQKSFPYRSLFGRIWQNPFLIGIPLSSTKRGGQDISLYMQSWVASKLVSGPSAYPTPLSFIGVSLLMASTFWCALPTPFTASIRSPHFDIYQGKLTVSPITVSLCLLMP